MIKKQLFLFLVLTLLSLRSEAQLFQDNFGTVSESISTTNWPSACRGGTASSVNTSTGPCGAAGDYNYSLSGFGSYITTLGIAIPATGYELTFDYSFNSIFSFPTVEIRSGAACGTDLLGTTTLTNTSGVCTSQSIDLSAYAGQTIYIRFKSNNFSTTFYIDNPTVDVVSGGGGTGDYKWADNFNDNDLDLDYSGNDGDEDCTGCGTWTLGGGASLELVPSAGWNGNTNKTEAFPASMPNVYYTKLDRNEWIESPTIDLSGKESVKISFYAKSSSPGTGGGDQWSFSDRLRLQIWDSSSWMTIQSLRDDLSSSWNGPDDYISAALPFNYFCFTAYKTTSSSGNYYYNSSPNVNSSYFIVDFKFRVIFEGGFSGAPFAWVDDFTFRADADGHSTMIPCGVSFWNEPAATSYGRDPGFTGNNNSEKGVELELDNPINIPPLWASEANDGDAVSQVFGANESEQVVFSVICEEEISSTFSVVNFYAPSMGLQSAAMSIDNNYSGPGWKYYSIQYISCDLAGGSIAEPTDDYQYFYTFQYGNEFIPGLYHLNASGIEVGQLATTSSLEYFNSPDVISSNDCGALPIELLSFTAIAEHQKVILEWQTATEINNDFFEIQRSENGIAFESIGKLVGVGNSYSILKYDFIDNSPFVGTSYYRLRQVDFNGDYSLSPIKSVYYSSDEIEVFPNPTNGILTIANYKGNTISILDITGKLIHKISVINHTLDLSHLPKGIYFLEFTSTPEKIIKKIIRG